MKLKFLGACGEVGKSAIFVETEQENILMDCGIKLGAESDTERYPYIPKSLMNKIDSVVITHAHLDHSGYLPHLYARGWRGNIYATKPTRDLMQLLLSDYLKIAKEERNPEFSQEEINNIMRDVIYLDYRDKEKLSQDTDLTLYNAGHILGSATVRFEGPESSLLYTGDLSYRDSTILDEADTDIEDFDHLIMETTYGGKKDQLPSLKTNSTKLAKEVKKTVERGGKVIIPSFGVGRGQELMITLSNYMKSGFLPDTPGYIDGMIKKANSIHRQNVIHAKDEIQKRILMAQENPFNPEQFNPPRTKDRSDVVKSDKPGVILTTSGMLTGGPVIKYVKELGHDPKNKIILVGYQVEGTPGRDLQDGKDIIELPDGEEVRIRADVKSLHFSAHADRQQLLEYVSDLPDLDKIFLVHGEEDKRQSINRELEERDHETYLPDIKADYEL